MSHTADEREGFAELLAVAGQPLSVDGESFTGLLKRLSPEDAAYDLTPNDNDQARIAAFRDGVPAAALRVGAHLSDSGGFHFRVVRIARPANREIVHLECVIVNP
jgi:hypothetical protein